MLEVQVNRDELHFGASVTARFMRTLRIPESAQDSLPLAGLGALPIYCVDDYLERVPAPWRVLRGVFIPMYQAEAMWMDFSARWWKPNAVKVGAGRVNTITGQGWHEQLSRDPQDYLVCPDQPCLCGIHTGQGRTRQFVASPTAGGLEFGGPLAERLAFSGIRLMVFEPKRGRFPEHAPAAECDEGRWCASTSEGSDVGLAAGRRLQLGLCRDEYGHDTWDQLNYGKVHIHIVNSQLFQQITGTEPPPTPVSAEHYAAAGLPWLDHYEE